MGRAGATLVLALALLASCRPAADAPQADVRVAMKVSPDPPVVGPATIDLTLRDGRGAPVRGATVALEGTMTHPGMAPSRAAAIEESPGLYRSHLELTMAGDWVLLDDTKLASGATAHHELALPAVAAR